MKNILLSLLLVCAAALHARGDTFSYLYIQGDKQTPFYVKLEEAMQPRYAKNYCIVPQLAPGPAHIEILFQQNIYPAQQFTVQIPEHGSRGFLLVKSETGFSLYDLQQGFYLPAGNNTADDKLPAVIAASLVALNNPVPNAVSAAPGPAVPAKLLVPGAAATTPMLPATQSAAKEPESANPAVTVKNDGPVFIQDLELGKGAATMDRDSNAAPPVVYRPPAIVVTNSDCPSPMSAAEFGKVFTGMSAFVTDEERLEYMNGKMDLCYESWEARTLAERLSGDAARYSLLKKIYPRITDQAAFPLLDDLLTTDTWKAAFAQLIHH